jgi:hypothetical protein
MECPFCGIVTDDPHESEEACIAALHAEIHRVREVVDCLRSAAVPAPAEPVEERDPTFFASGDEGPQF